REFGIDRHHRRPCHQASCVVFQMAYRRRSGCCVSTCACSTTVAWVRKISIAILITHILAMILFCFTAFIIWAPWAAVITAIAYLTGIVTSAIVISTPTQSSYR
ncbi:unnamed protein product, partial [Scytosiphon promiscuus]